MLSAMTPRRAPAAVLCHLLSLAVLGGLLLPRSGLAHDEDILYVQAHRSAADSRDVTEVVTLTAASLARLAPVDADGDGALTDAELLQRKLSIEAGVWGGMPLSAGGVSCTLAETTSALKSRFVELQARFDCGPGELVQSFRLLSILPDNYKVVLGSVVDGEKGQRFATARLQTLTLSSSAEKPAPPALTYWIELGGYHIFTGFDHLAFLVALLLVGGTLKRLLLLVTSFTLAHSVTLGLTALDVIVLGDTAVRYVEATIALSIIWVAAENLILREHRHRAALTFLFGLVHGFGFASVLRGYGLGDDAVAGLFGFNLGVELGQAAVVLALYPVVRLLEKHAVARQWTVRAVSFGVMGAGLFWLVERIA